MVTVDTSFKELKSLISKDLTVEKLDRLLFDMGMELDSNQGDALRIDVTPDRPDMVSLYGLARAIRAYNGSKKGMPKYTINKSDYIIKVDSSVNDVRPFTVAAVVKNLKLDNQKIKEMIWVQEKLHQTFARGRKKAAIGIYPMEAIKFPINYLAEDPKKIKFHPLESDKEMTGHEILKDHPTGKEFAHLLEGKKKFPIFRDAKNNILSMPPIINSHNTGRVTEKTESVFIECSGHDLQSLNILINILVTMFSDMGGKIFSVQINYDKKKLTTPDLKESKMKIKVDEINKKLGTKLNSKECKDLFERMLYDVKIDTNQIEVSIPAFRSDIWHQVDLIDDVARAYGFNNLKPTTTPAPSVGGTLAMTDFEETIAELLVGAGFNECFTFALTSSDDQFTKMCIKEIPHIKLGTTAEKSINMVRCNLMPELIKVIVSNRNKPFPQKIFEVSDVVIPDSKADVLSKNMKRLSIIVSDASATFTDINQALTYLLSILNVEFTLEPTQNKTFIDGRCGKIIVKSKEIGLLGELHPQVLNNHGIEMPTVGLELDITSLFAIFKNSKTKSQ